ncbi:MAG: HSP20 family protein [Cyclobacteriaceae bacterium]|jgi:HSP20 family protein
MTLIKYNQNNTPATYGSFIDRFFNEDAFGRKLNSTFSPKVDVAETDKAFEILFHIPGVSKEDVTIDIKDDRLTVSGERKFENEKKEKNFHSIESYYGNFSRSFYLPDNINTEKVEATYTDGILMVVIPKDEKKETKRTVVIK